MLLEIKVKNFRSIKDWQTFSMLAESKVKEMKESVVKSANLNILNSAILYGRNASGKSNILNSFKALQYLVVRSAEYKVDEDIESYEPFKLCPVSNKNPTEFSIDFLAKNGLRYIYSIGFSKKEIEYELSLRFELFRLKFLANDEKLDFSNKISSIILVYSKFIYR